jgi:molybdopterin-biosynthesis enzyme MoeA-like protein
MNAGYDYVWEKLNRALLCLLGTGSLADRLEGAGRSLMGLRREQFVNDDEDARWSAIMERLSALEDTVSEGGIAATTEAMTRNQQDAVTREIVDLHERHIVAMTRRELGEK